LCLEIRADSKITPREGMLMDEGDSMPQVPDRHNRRSIRPKEYEYAQPGAYFFTTCTQTRACLFGEIVEYQMKLNSAGEMVNKVWHEIPAHYAGVEIDVFVVMPNHVHGIISILENSHVGAVPCDRPKNGQPQGVAPTLIVARGNTSIQNDDHKTIRRWGEKDGLASFP